MYEALEIEFIGRKNTCGKMPGCFSDITAITARTRKRINHTRTKPATDRVFQATQVAILQVVIFFTFLEALGSPRHWKDISKF